MQELKFTTEQIELVRSQFMPNETSASQLKLFIATSERTGLDPFARQIYATARKSKNKYGEWETNLVILTSIDGLRLIAERSGQYAGQVGPWWCGKDGRWVEVWLDSAPPLAAKVGVLKSTFKEPLFAVARYDAYVQTKSDGKPNSTWDRMADIMLAKVAEALALRKAFPNDMSGLYTGDEMGKVIDHDTEPTQPPPVAVPKEVKTITAAVAKTKPEAPSAFEQEDYALAVTAEAATSLNQTQRITERPVLTVEEEAQIAEFVFTVGKYAGKKLTEVHPQDLKNYRDKILPLCREPEHFKIMDTIKKYLDWSEA